MAQADKDISGAPQAAEEGVLSNGITADGETTDEMEHDAIHRAWLAAQIADRRPQLSADIEWAARTDIGRVRDHNEDKFDFYVPEEPHLLAVRGRLWAVADGMGGHSAGQIASEAALKILIRTYFFDLPSGGDIPQYAMQVALREANNVLRKASKDIGAEGNMGTTVVAAAITDDRLTIAHIGDSRAYLLRPGSPIRALTTDHSWVEEQVRRGVMSREDAEASQYRNYITRSVGMTGSVSADVTSESLSAGDVILLCTDGVTGYLTAEDLEERVLASAGLSQAALSIIDAANDAGGRDNSTVLLVRILSISPVQ